MNQEEQANATLEIMTLAEAAIYLRVSKSTLYQRKDIPRHRMPGSREVRFLKDELIAWLKSGEGAALPAASRGLVFPLDSAPATVYHRNPKYRG
ncbi:MAG: putative Excisionase [Nitrospira sp.]|jgi:excisionase family DNA binding protein|nr:putative Excisionase [Nitrospira sp.]